ncbi:MAG: Cyclic nucleotide-binding protein [Ilumatobacteraceae bacterium]|nr:Cyclic nucleotide-binding protein [Ilumatobacteraceae bacterium]
MACMRSTASITALSWIPSEAIAGLAKLPFRTGLAHFDVAPPARIDTPGATLEELRAADRFRFANRLDAWIEVDDDGKIVDAGYAGGGLLGSTTLSLGRGISIAAVPLPDKQAEPEFGPGWVRFLQTAGGRTGVPAPRTVRRPPFIQYHAPIAWSTLALTIHADGTAEGQLVGASPFPRHWVYDTAGQLLAKTGLIDFKTWYKEAFGDHTPWGDLDSPALVTAVETALERELSKAIMRGSAKPKVRTVKAGATLVNQGDEGDEMYVLLDGVLGLEVDGHELAELGPGTVAGERAILEGGRRTATLRAVTTCKVAVASAATVDIEALRRLSADHRREHANVIAK